MSKYFRIYFYKTNQRHTVFVQAELLLLKKYFDQGPLMSKRMGLTNSDWFRLLNILLTTIIDLEIFFSIF